MNDFNPDPEPIPAVRIPLVSYGSWYELLRTESPEDHVRKAMEAWVAGCDPEPRVDLGRACRDFRQVISWCLPEGVELIGSLFYGLADTAYPAYPRLSDGRLDVRSVVQVIDLDVILRRHEIRDGAA